MASKIHGIVENAEDLDDTLGLLAIHDEMPPALAVSSDMEATQVVEKVGAGKAARRVGTLC